MSVDPAAIIWYGIRTTPPSLLTLLEQEQEKSDIGEWSKQGVCIQVVMNYDDPIGFGAVIAYADTYVTQPFDLALFDHDLGHVKEVVDELLAPFNLEEKPDYWFQAIWT